MSTDAIKYFDGTKTVVVTPTAPLPVTIPASATVSTNLAQVAGNPIVTGSGVVNNTTLRVTLATDVALPAGTNLLGVVGIDRTTPGTTNTVAIISGQNGVAANVGVVGGNVPRVTLVTDVALPAGTNLLGKVGIDQSAPGSSNLVQTPTPASIVPFQYKVTAAAVQMAANALVNGITIKAKTGNNAAGVFIGGAGVTTTNDGTGNGFVLYPGDTLSLAISNTNVLFVIGTANDVLYFMGN